MWVFGDYFANFVEQLQSENDRLLLVLLKIELIFYESFEILFPLFSSFYIFETQIHFATIFLCDFIQTPQLSSFSTKASTMKHPNYF